MPANDRLLLGKAGMAAMGGQIQPSSARKKIGMVFHVEHFVVTEVYLHRFCRQPVKRKKSALVKTS